MKGKVLHTSSAWAVKEIDLTFQKRSDSEIDDSINKLRSSEQKLYKEFGKNDYEGFIIQLRSFFNKDDMEAISRFEPKYLEQALRKFASGRGKLYEQKVEIVLHLDKLKDFNLREGSLREAVKNKGLAAMEAKEQHDPFFKIDGIEGDLPKITLTYNYNTIKTVLNTFFKGHNFTTTADVMRNADALINRLAAPEVNAIEATILRKDNPDYREKFIFSTIPNFPWGLDKKTYLDAKNNNPDESKNEVLKEVKRAVKEIKEYIINELVGNKASQDLRDAAVLTWEKNFIDKENNPALFFSGGKTDNFIGAVQGALGEFQTALIFTFLHKKLGSSKYAEIIGNIYKKGTSEQLKTDVQIANSIGLQVKNVSIIKDELGNEAFVRDLEAGAHPDKLEYQLAQGEQFVTYIANYYFNTTFQDETKTTFNQMIDMLQGYLGEVMNMAINEGIDDNISFYLIAGKYLVPASEILEAAKELQLRENLEVTSSYKGKSDEEYYEKIGRTRTLNQDGKKKKKSTSSPLFTDYWRRNKAASDGWDPYFKNKILFNELISSRISIKTHFNIMKKIEQYALF